MNYKEQASKILFLLYRTQKKIQQKSAEMNELKLLAVQVNFDELQGHVPNAVKGFRQHHGYVPRYAKIKLKRRKINLKILKRKLH